VANELQHVAPDLKRRSLRGLAIVLLLMLIGLGIYLAATNGCGWYYYQAAENALEIGDYNQAEENLDNCLRFWPANGQVHFWMARTARSLGKFDKAKEHLSKAEELHWSPEGLELEEKLLRAQQGEFSEVEQDLLAYGKVDNEHTGTVLEVLATEYSRNSQLAAAMKWGNRFLKHSPRNVNALLAMARIHEAIHHSTDSLKYYRRAVNVQPDNNSVRQALANALLAFNEPAEARTHFQEIESRGDSSKGVLLGLARCYRALGQSAEAKKTLDQLAARYPNAWEVWSERGRLALRDGNAKQAEKCLRQAEALHPYDSAVLYNLYLSLKQQGKAKRAEAEVVSTRYRKLVDDLKRFDELMLKRKAEKPNDPGVTFEIAMILMRIGEEKTGEQWLHKVLQLRPHHRGARRALAKYYEKIGNKERAAKHLQVLR
jgi:tetratricopeptide (TPR) repeat protein